MYYNKTFVNTLLTTFGNLDRNSGIFATEVSYTDLNGVAKVQRFPIEVSSGIIDGIAQDKPISYRSLYLPDTLCIDTFYTAYREYKPSLVYFRNLGNPFVGQNISGRWGVIADWTTNAAANPHNGGLRGSWDNNTGVGVLAFESGWSYSTPVVNGKIYQTTTLAAGKYQVSIEFRRNNVTANVDATNNSIYFVVTDNGSIPDVADVLSADKLGYYDLAWINDAYRVVSFEFDNPVTQEVTIGFVGNLTSSSNQFFNVKGMSFIKID